jgi:squalene-hopene/tetraprenyl-beta-curcumene cyclase
MRTLGYGRGIVSLVCVGVVLSTGGTIAAPAETDGAEQSAKQSVRRGLDWMTSVQKDDGSWSNGNFPALTALGLWAFARSDHPDRQAVCAKAAAFVAGFVREDGGIYRPGGLGRSSGGLSTYNTAICMVALHAYDKAKYENVILRAREFIAASQLVGDSPGAGGFGYGKPTTRTRKVMYKLMGWGNRADLSNTGWAAQAMRLTQDLEDRRTGGKRVDIDWEATLAYVDRLQNQDPDDADNHGSFGYEEGGSRGGTKKGAGGKVSLRGYGSMTYAGLESMIYAQVGLNDPRVRSALAWAADHWSVDENPGMGTKGLFYYYTIMGKALSLSRSSTLTGTSGRAVPWQKELVAKLVASQHADGSWVNENNQFWEGDASLVTSYAVLTLEYAMGR